MDVGEWLRRLGLDQYEQRFRDNKIDAEVLPRLKANDLRELGVVAVGDRRKLLAAIAGLASSSVLKQPQFQKPLRYRAQRPSVVRWP